MTHSSALHETALSPYSRQVFAWFSNSTTLLTCIWPVAQFAWLLFLNLSIGCFLPKHGASLLMYSVSLPVDSRQLSIIWMPNHILQNKSSSSYTEAIHKLFRTLSSLPSKLFFKICLETDVGWVPRASHLKCVLIGQWTTDPFWELFFVHILSSVYLFYLQRWHESQDISCLFLLPCLLVWLPCQRQKADWLGPDKYMLAVSRYISIL